KQGPWLAYALGYRLAAESLIDKILNGGGKCELVYPAIFCYRHFLELELKAITSLALLVVARSTDGDGNGEPISPATESEAVFKESKPGLVSLFKYVDPVLRACLTEERDAIETLGGCIHEISKHDPNSFAFRYPTRKTLDSFTLEGLPRVDLSTFRR